MMSQTATYMSKAELSQFLVFTIGVVQTNNRKPKSFSTFNIVNHIISQVMTKFYELHFIIFSTILKKSNQILAVGAIL